MRIGIGLKIWASAGSAIALWSMSNAWAAAPASSPTGSTRVIAVTNVRIFDGDNVIPKGTVLFSGGTILAVGSDISAPHDAQVIDGRGKTIMPGLIDAHVHIIGRTKATGALGLEQAAVYGITTVEDMSGADADGFALLQKIKNGEVPTAADIFVGGGTQGVKVPSDAADAVKRGIELGADHIGEMNYDTQEQHFIYRPQVDDETLKALIDAGHAAGKEVVIHVLQVPRAKLAVLDGADGLVHISPYDPPDADFGRMLAAHHVWQSTNINNYAPTIYFKELASDPQLAPLMSPEMIQYWANHQPVTDSRHACSIANLKNEKAANVSILAGTDLGTPYPPMLHIEIEIFVKDAGFTPVEALKTATSNVVDAYKIHDRGRISPGLRADLLLLNGDPTTDITATRNIAAVWENGYGIDRDAFKANVKSIPFSPQGNPQPDPNGPQLTKRFDACATFEPEISKMR